MSIERAKIEHEITDGAGTLKVEGKIDCTMQPYRGPGREHHDAQQLDLLDGAGLAGVRREGRPPEGRHATEIGQWELEGKNAIQSDWKIDYRGE